MNERLLRDLYTAFNARDIDTALAGMSADIDWPNGWEGGRVHGHHAVRSYWGRQWAEVNSRAEPVKIRSRPDGRIEVEVRQTAHDAVGELLWEGRILHIYEIRDGLVTRMDIEDRHSAG